MYQINNKKNDDQEVYIDNDLDLCNCNLCWLARKITLSLPNNVLFRNSFVLFILMFILPIIFFVRFVLLPIILYII